MELNWKIVARFEESLLEKKLRKYDKPNLGLMRITNLRKSLSFVEFTLFFMTWGWAMELLNNDKLMQWGTLRIPVIPGRVVEHIL